MILRREFFKKVLIGSIFALQFTVTCPVYNALAVEPTTDKTFAEEDESAQKDEDAKSDPGDEDVDSAPGDEDAKSAQGDENAENTQGDEELRKAEKSNLTEKDNSANESTKSKIAKIAKIYNLADEAEKSKLAKIAKIVEEAEKAEKAKIAKKAEEAEKSKKAKEERERPYNDRIEKYEDDIENIRKRIKSIEKRLKELNLDLTHFSKMTDEEIMKIPEEQRIKFQECYKGTEMIKVLNSDISKISEKIEKAVHEKNEINRKAEEAKKVEEAEKEGWKLYHYKNDNDLIVKILSDQHFVKNWASIADKLGFGWCGGTNSPYVGEDYSVEKTGDNEYTLMANYNSSDPHADGYQSDYRTNIKVSNIKFYIDGDSIKYGEPRIVSFKPITVASGFFTNEDDKKPAKGELNFTYIKTTTVSRQDNFSFKQQIGTQTKFMTGIPGIASNETTVSMTLDFGQGWSDTKTNSTTKSYAKKITIEIDPRHKQKVELVAAEQTVEVPYKARIYMSYDITLDGFLRWIGNAHIDHPKDRPHCTVTFGDSSKGQNAVEFIKDIYDNKDTSGYSQWDFNWSDKHHAKPYPIKDHIDKLCRYKLGGSIEGVFKGVDGTEGQLIARDQVPLSTPDDDLEENLQDSVVFKRIE